MNLESIGVLWTFALPAGAGATAAGRLFLSESCGLTTRHIPAIKSNNTAIHANLIMGEFFNHEFTLVDTFEPPYHRWRDHFRILPQPPEKL
jgi:hypothetical protein